MKIRKQVDRILSSPEFVASKQINRFLRYVVDQTLDGRADHIKQYTIAVEAHGYDNDFDPQADSVIRIQAARLRQALDRYYSSWGTNDPVRVEIPKGSYVPVFHDLSVRSDRRRQPDRPTRAKKTPRPAMTEPSVTVMLFSSRQASRAQTDIAESLAHELTAALTRFTNIVVKGPFVDVSNGQTDFTGIAEQHGTRFILTCWLRQQDSRIRLTTGLNDAKTGSEIWGKTFDYNLETTSLFEIEDDVTSQVAGIIADDHGTINRTLYAEACTQPDSFSSGFLAALHYYHAWATHSQRDWENAFHALNSGLDNEPDNALLNALFADLCYVDTVFSLGLVADARVKMAEYAYKAIALDPDQQEARFNLLQLGAFETNEGNHEKIRALIALNPYQARINAACAILATILGDFQLGVTLMEKARHLNPHYPCWYHVVDYLVKYAGGQYDEAWNEAQRFNFEGLFWHPLLRAAILGKLKRGDEAKDYLGQLFRLWPDFPQRPRDYITRALALDEHIEMILDGLEQAGMNIADSARSKRA